MTRLTARTSPLVLAPTPADAERLGVARRPWSWPRPARRCSAAQLVPVYHRLSQAERERLEREQAAQTPHPQ
ncbi:MAG: hypothetical protein ACLRWQ_13955 [Flavonifractor plautii]